MKYDGFQRSFAAGEISPLLSARTDVKHYEIGVKQCRNFIPLVQGPARRRTGTRYVAPTKGNAKVWLARFVFNYSQAYILEFGDGYIRFFANRGRVIVTGAADWNGGTTYAEGEYVTYSGLTYRSKQGGNLNQQPDTQAAWWDQTDIYEISSPWSAADLTDTDGTFKLRMVQSGDVIYICHPSHKPRTLNRRGATDWTIEEFDTLGGPFAPTNSTETTVYIDETWTGPGMSGDVTVKASTGIFQADHVGSLFFLQQQDFSAVPPWEPAKEIAVNDLRRNDFKTYEAQNSKWTGTKQPLHEEGTQLDGSGQIANPDGSGTMEDAGVEWAFSDPGFVVLKIASFTNATTVEATIMEPVPGVQKGVPKYVCGSGNASDRWAFGAFNKVDGWPSCVTFFRDRLTFAKNQSLYFSVPQDFTDFSARGLDNQVRSDNAFWVTVSSDRVDNILWAIPANALVIGTTGGELSCAENTTQDAFGPNNRKIAPETRVGSSGVSPEVVGAAPLFVDRSKSEVRKFGFNYDDNGYQARSEQKAWEHITKPGISDMAFALAPDSILWMARDDGILVGQTKLEDEDTLAWHRHPIGGNDDDAGETAAFVEAVESIPSPDGKVDDLWLIVRRRINGQTVRYVEYLSTAPDMPTDLIPPASASDAVLALYLQNNEARRRLAFAQRLYADSGLTYDQPLTVTGVTATNPVVITSADHGLSSGLSVKIDGMVGMTQLNGKIFTVGSVTTDTFELEDTDGTDFVPYVSGGQARRLVTTISGLDHLEGQTVQIATDGAAHPDRVVTDGAIQLQYPAAVVQVGLGYRSLLELLPPDIPLSTGTSQGRKIRISRCRFRFFETLGGRAGKSEYEADPILYRAGGQTMGVAPLPITGDWPESGIVFQGGYDRVGAVVVIQDQPLPMTVCGVLPEIENN